MKSIIDSFEIGLFPMVDVICEPQLGKRELRPTISQKGYSHDANIRADLIAYADGKHSLFDISNKINKSLELILSEVKILKDNKLINLYKNKI
jgi:aminopeptidase-like protein